MAEVRTGLLQVVAAVVEAITGVRDGAGAARRLGVGTEAGAVASGVRRPDRRLSVSRVQRVDGQQPLGGRPVLDVSLQRQRGKGSAAAAGSRSCATHETVFLG